MVPRRSRPALSPAAAQAAPGSPVRSSGAVRCLSSRRLSVPALVASLPAQSPPLFVTPPAGVSAEQPSRQPVAGCHAACGGLTSPPYQSLRSLGGDGPGSRSNAVRGRGPPPAPSPQHGSPPSQAMRRANGPPLRCGPSSRRTAWCLPRGGYRPRRLGRPAWSVGPSPACASDGPTARLRRVSDDGEPWSRSCRPGPACCRYGPDIPPFSRRRGDQDAAMPSTPVPASWAARRRYAPGGWRPTGAAGKTASAHFGSRTISASGPQGPNPLSASGLPRNFGKKYLGAPTRWLSRDPIEENGGVNLYAYVENSPISQIDVWGLCESSPPGHRMADPSQMGGGGGGPLLKPTSPNQMRQQVNTKQAPKTVERVDPAHNGHGNNEPHVHFYDGRALTLSGAWSHVGRQGPNIWRLSNDEAAWLVKNGWKVPLKCID